MKNNFIVNIVVILALLNVTAQALASDEAPQNEKFEVEKTKEENSLCPALDYRNRFSKKFIGEIDVFGGAYFGDYLLTSWAAGGRALMHVNHRFTFGGEYIYSNLSVDSLSSFGLVKHDNNQQIIDGQIAINWEILFGAGQRHLPMDLFMTLGAGSININDKWNWLALVGGGLKVYLKPEWLAIRIDVNSYLHNTPTSEGNKLGSNLAFLLGLAFHFPYTHMSMK